jgi:transposase InsO family protein
VELRDQVQRVALEWPTYGRRRITAELGRCGLSVNRKRVQRLMREDNLLCLRRRKLVATTDSAHGLKVYPNLAAALVVSGIDQLRRASCESFMKTLKCEEVYRSEYRNLAEARARIGEFLEEIYNQKRLHSSLGYCPPAEFERLQSSPMLVAAVAQEAV